MRILHTSDWHLGRLFHGLHLTDDQAHVLDQFVALVADAKPDAVVIAGDVYDRSVPPVDAVALLDETLARIAVDLATPVVLIAGNHDSADRIAFGRRLMKESRVYVAGAVGPATEPIVFGDEHGPVAFYALPYAEPPVVREIFGDETIRDHQSAMQAAVGRIRATIEPGTRSVLVAHAFVAGGSESESERPLSVGGAGTVSANVFDGFDYVALGHLHRPQSITAERLAYSGSVLKYSFAESGHAKSVSLVDLDRRGQVTVERISLSPRRDVRCLTGTFAEILAGPGPGENREDYVSIALTDRSPILDAIGRIRAVYPHCLHVDRSAFFGTATAEQRTVHPDHRSHSLFDLFDAFVSDASGEPMSAAERAAFVEIVEALEREERESEVPDGASPDPRRLTAAKA